VWLSKRETKILKDNLRVLVCTDPGTVHSQRFIQSLAKKTHVALYWMGNSRERLELNVSQFPKLINRPLKSKWLNYYLEQLAVIFTLAIYKPDVIHVHVKGLWCKRFKRWAPDTPMVFTSWGHIPESQLKSEWGQWVALVDGFTGDSSELVGELKNIEGCSGKPSTIFRFGVSEDFFQFAPPSEELKKNLSLPVDCKIIYSPRSLRDGYNHETLVKAIPNVLSKVPNAYFLFVNNHGHRYPDAVLYTEMLKNEIADLGVSSHVRFLEHLEPRSRVASLFQTADVAICIPTTDGFPVTILEAMSCGTPLIVSDLPDYADVVDEENAIRINPLDVRELARSIVMILTDEKKKNQMRTAGLAAVSQKGDMNKELDKLIIFYRSIMNKG
jgi:glycosyltransferase involved in cell wall biosynthesis